MSDILEDIKRSEEIGAISFEMAGKFRALVAENEGRKEAMAELYAELHDARSGLESEKLWAKRYATRAQEFRDSIGQLLAYRSRNSPLTVQIEKLDAYIANLRVLYEKQP